jgi:hypothetical protein
MDLLGQLTTSMANGREAGGSGCRNINAGFLAGGNPAILRIS